jgi:antitoxin (DNA-binding transcriptional repressor) of toxin-antitoxin stability system
MTAAHADGPERVPVTKLIHESQAVLGLVEAGKHVQVTRHGKVIAVISPPHPDEVALDELAAAGQVPVNWREQQDQLRQTLRASPARTSSVGSPAASLSIVQDREDTDR